MPTLMTRTYTELSLLRSFDERFEYLRLGGGVGRATFGFDRYINQAFYTSREWHDVRDFVIVRDNGCDLGVEGHEIFVEPLIHHINPMRVEDLVDKAQWVLDPEYLITTRHATHNAIHYGVRSQYPKVVAERTPGDTRLW